jgi:porphobilinogen synthase
MVRQLYLHPSDLICPLFVTDGEGIQKEIASMPGQFQLSIDRLDQEAGEISGLGIPAVILFGIPAAKDSEGSGAYHPNGIIQRAIRHLKATYPDLIVITDVCLCEYTSHGHCGLVNDPAAPHGQKELAAGHVLNDPTLELLGKIALSHAQAGADIVAPSAMMDGMVAKIRGVLDVGGFSHIPIISYSVKYCSSFYGPFRDAAEGAPQFGDRKTHQMDPAESRQALREATLDVQEGADFLMVKPALAYLDVIYQLRQRFPEMPIVAYNVSGEYAMIKAAAQNGWLDEQSVVLESLIGMKRAGADLIITYHSKDLCRWLKQKK